jgi:thiol-disulfide isomerase/thioredoxin
MNLNDFKAKFGKYANNTQFLVILLVVLLFIIAALIVYRRYISAGLTRDYVANNEFTNDGGALQSVDIYFFYTTWCPHCKTAKPIWEDFREEMKDKKVNGIKLNFFEVDCDKDTATSDKFKVKGFPTIKLVKGKQIIEYDAKPNKVTLIEFVNTSLKA